MGRCSLSLAAAALLQRVRQKVAMPGDILLISLKNRATSTADLHRRGGGAWGGKLGLRSRTRWVSFTEFNDRDFIIVTVFG